MVVVYYHEWHLIYYFLHSSTPLPRSPCRFRIARRSYVYYSYRWEIEFSVVVVVMRVFKIDVTMQRLTPIVSIWMLLRSVMEADRTGRSGLTKIVLPYCLWGLAVTRRMSYNFYFGCRLTLSVFGCTVVFMAHGVQECFLTNSYALNFDAHYRQCWSW